LLRVVLNFVI